MAISCKDKEEIGKVVKDYLGQGYIDQWRETMADVKQRVEQLGEQVNKPVNVFELTLERTLAICEEHNCNIPAETILECVTKYACEVAHSEGFVEYCKIREAGLNTRSENKGGRYY